MKLFPLAFVLLCFSQPTWARERTDIVTLTNGDRVTGEVKKLERGLLSVKTDGMSTISIEWDDVNSVVSRYAFEMELNDGRLLNGTMEESPTPGQLRLAGSEETTDFSMGDVVGLVPVDDRFWQRFNGDFSLGASYGKSSEVFQLNFNGSLAYRAPTYFTTLTASNTLTTQPNEPSTQHADYNLSTKRFLSRNWFTGGGLMGQRNDELGLDFRILVQGGGGRALYRTNSATFTVQTALAYNREWVKDATPSDSMEAPVEIEYSVFLYDSPKTNLTTALTTYPSVTDPGRVRVEFNGSLRQEIVKDFFVELNAYDSYDSSPQTPGSSKNDYGFVTSIGYSFD